MARMVSDHPASGARERLVLGRELFALLREQRQAGASPGRLLALRSAAISHAYVALVSLSQQAAKAAGIPGWAAHTSLAALERAVADDGAQVPELALLAQARADHRDPVCWLEQQQMLLFSPHGLSQRPQPRNEDEGPLVMAREDAEAPLQEQDLARLDAALARVAALIEECVAYSAEW